MLESKLPKTTEEVHALLGHDDEIIKNTVTLADSDYALIGRFVQAYTWADLNARRAVNLLRVLNRHESQEFATRLNEKATLEHLKSEALAMSVLPDVQAGLAKVVDILEMHHDVRHIFAHWAVRRVRDADGYIALTKFGREASRRGVSLDSEGDVIAYCFMPVQELKVECQKLYGHGEYLAGVVGLLAEFIEKSSRAS